MRINAYEVACRMHTSALEFQYIRGSLRRPSIFLVSKTFAKLASPVTVFSLDALLNEAFVSSNSMTSIGIITAQPIILKGICS